ncbi:hypothetical protein AURDEDRAFT_160709 [Auricularia subglabra TFB-10046 SS5]|nr:hypothetical protein AURDEDRAFT_160709 [Auricularia subglabra TFB-10046 SS5]
MDSPSALRPLQIAIVGGGVAGLALAGTLAKYGAGTGKLEVAIYEAAASFEGEAGAGIAVHGRSFEIVKALGMEDALAEIDQAGAGTDETYGFVYRRSDQGPEGHDFVLRKLGNTPLSPASPSSVKAEMLLSTSHRSETVPE